MVRRTFLSISIVLVLLSAAAQPKTPAKPAVAAAAAAPKITTPKEQFGFNIGDDYQLATYTQLEQYWKKLATESPRVKLVDIGKTAEGRTQWMCIVTSPENHKKLDRYKEIS